MRIASSTKSSGRNGKSFFVFTTDDTQFVGALNRKAFANETEKQIGILLVFIRMYIWGISRKKAGAFSMGWGCFLCTR